ncbi:MAG: hypothetical protein BMS9Abin05_2143 [Rhodothermia bacterium]|nr:MAG: hypothetical protein BMS9Abin05_2143 [Rhodothermia bacterium]
MHWKKEKIQIVAIILASAGFGFWQESINAGMFMLLFLVAIESMFID